MNIHCTTCNRQVLHDGTTCCVCAEGELAFGMPEPDCYGTSPTHDPDIGSYNEWHGWYVGPDGITSIERYAKAKAAEAERLREIVERLPVTADGVRVVPGDTVLWLRIGPRGGVRIERVKVGCEGEIGTWWCSDNCNSMGDEWELLQDSLADCYATIEAVEAPPRRTKGEGR